MTSSPTRGQGDRVKELGRGAALQTIQQADPVLSKQQECDPFPSHEQEFHDDRDTLIHHDKPLMVRWPCALGALLCPASVGLRKPTHHPALTPHFYNSAIQTALCFAPFARPSASAHAATGLHPRLPSPTYLPRGQRRGLFFTRWKKTDLSILRKKRTRPYTNLHP